MRRQLHARNHIPAIKAHVGKLLTHFAFALKFLSLFRCSNAITKINPKIWEQIGTMRSVVQEIPKQMRLKFLEVLINLNQDKNKLEILQILAIKWCIFILVKKRRLCNKLACSANKPLPIPFWIPKPKWPKAYKEDWKKVLGRYSLVNMAAYWPAILNGTSEP